MPALSSKTLADLAKSGLDAADALKLKIADIPQAQMSQIMHGANVWAYEIPYFDLNGQLIGFSRYKLLEPYKAPKDKKPRKYIQPANTISHFYLAPLLDWLAIAHDPKVEIWFVEGEKKAAAMCKHGFATIGLAGVNNWLVRGDDGSEPIDDFGLIDLKGRKTIIAFDSDA